MDKLDYKYCNFVIDTKILSKKIDTYNFDTIVAIARGGMTLGHFLAQSLNIRNISTINSILYDDKIKTNKCKISNIPNLDNCKKVLIVDDMVDSGETMTTVLALLSSLYPNCQFKTATIFYKPTSSILPDFTIKQTTKWVEFFWEKDI